MGTSRNYQSDTSNRVSMQTTRTSHLRLNAITGYIQQYSATTEVIRANLRVAKNIVEAKKAAHPFIHQQEQLRELQSSKEYESYTQAIGQLQQECVEKDEQGNSIGENGNPRINYDLFNLRFSELEDEHGDIIKLEKELKKSIQQMGEMYVPVKVDILEREWLKKFKSEKIGQIAFMFPTIISTKDLPENVGVQDFILMMDYCLIFDDKDSAGNSCDESTFYVDEDKLI